MRAMKYSMFSPNYRWNLKDVFHGCTSVNTGIHWVYQKNVRIYTLSKKLPSLNRQFDFQHISCRYSAKVAILSAAIVSLCGGRRYERKRK